MTYSRAEDALFTPRLGLRLKILDVGRIRNLATLQTGYKKIVTSVNNFCILIG